MSFMGLGEAIPGEDTLGAGWVKELYGVDADDYNEDGLRDALNGSGFSAHLSMLGEDGMKAVIDLLAHQRVAGMRGTNTAAKTVDNVIDSMPVSGRILGLSPESNRDSGEERDALTIAYLMGVTTRDEAFVRTFEDRKNQDGLFRGFGMFREHGAKWAHDALVAYFDASGSNGLNGILSDADTLDDMSGMLRAAIGHIGSMADAPTDIASDPSGFGRAISEAMLDMVSMGAGPEEFRTFGDFEAIQTWRTALGSKQGDVPACTYTTDAVFSVLGNRRLGESAAIMATSLAYAAGPRDWSAVEEWLSSSWSTCDAVIHYAHDGRHAAVLTILDFMDVIIMAMDGDPANPDFGGAARIRTALERGFLPLFVIEPSPDALFITIRGRGAKTFSIPSDGIHDAIRLLRDGYPKDMVSQTPMMHPIPVRTDKGGVGCLHRDRSWRNCARGFSANGFMRPIWRSNTKNAMIPSER